MEFPWRKFKIVTLTMSKMRPTMKGKNRWSQLEAKKWWRVIIERLNYQFLLKKAKGTVTCSFFFGVHQYVSHYLRSKSLRIQTDLSFPSITQNKLSSLHICQYFTIVCVIIISIYFINLVLLLLMRSFTILQLQISQKI